MHSLTEYSHLPLQLIVLTLYTTDIIIIEKVTFLVINLVYNIVSRKQKCYTNARYLTGAVIN